MNLLDTCSLISMGFSMILAFYIHITCFDFKLTQKWKIWVILIVMAVVGHPLRTAIDEANSMYMNFFAIFTMYNFLPVLILASGSLWGKLYCFYLQASVAFSITLFSSFFSEVFFLYSSSRHIVMSTLLTLTFYLVYAFFMRRYGNTLFRNLFSYIKGKMWVVFSVVPYCSFILIKGICFYGVPVLPKPLTGEISDILLPVIVMGSLFALTASILTVQSRIADQSELKLAKGIISSGHEFYDKLTVMTENLQHQRHDHKFQLRTIQTLLDNSNSEDAKHYLETLTSKLDETYMKEYCQSRVINALVSSYEDKCTEDGIEFFAQIELDEDLTIDEYELSIIIGNLLENAVTACRRTPEGERRYIDVVLRRHDKNFGIMVENSFDGALKLTPHGLESTKTGWGEPVGMGIDSIKAIIKQNCGEYIPNWDEKKFSAYVVIKLNEYSKVTYTT